MHFLMTDCDRRQNADGRIWAMLIGCWSLSPVNRYPGTGQDSNGRRKQDTCRRKPRQAIGRKSRSKTDSNVSRSGYNPPERATSTR
jgi:hypothetical protein